MSLVRIYSITLVLFVFHLLGVSQSAVQPPRLVIGIMVDGLQQKHIEQLWPYMDPAGLKRIMGEGARFKNVSYNVISAGNSSDIATVMTGSVPFYHGIAGDHFYNRKTDQIRLFTTDEKEIGIGTTDKYSAYQLLASTVMDELKLTYPGKTKTYAVGINAPEAILLAGHTANSAVWMDDENHKWVATGYYREGLCKSADQMNVSGAFKTISQREWKPMYALNTYTSSSVESKKTEFSIRPTDKKSKNSVVTLLKNTPSANTLVAELGTRIVNDEQLGKDNITDMLMLQFTVRTPNEKLFSLQSIEKEDMYLRLDRDIQTLLQKIDVQVGLDKTLVFLVGNQTDVHSPSELGENSIPAGYFNASSSMALLNTYLMAMYGYEKWVLGYYGKNIYLNKSKIEEKKIRFEDVQKSVVNFMPEFAGIQAAYTSQQVLSMGGDSNLEMARLRNSTHKNSMGDVIFTLMPGWLELDEQMRPVGESNAITSYMPLAFYGWRIKPAMHNASYQATDIAPTLSRLLNLPIPNASIGKPIKELLD
jgi:Type I phosphodiesterase / nucleotide pyrophosphatase